jgi:pteridine reductase
VAERFGGLDVLINSAGIMTRATLADTTPALWDEVMTVNLRALFFTSQGAAPLLKQAKGRIINLADVGGLEPWPRYAAHTISKAGVVMLTKVLARALAPDVTVNAVAPGAVLPPDDWDDAALDRLARTTPLKRLGSPEDVTAAILYLLERGDFVTGQTLVVDGGRLVR